MTRGRVIALHFITLFRYHRKGQEAAYQNVAKLYGSRPALSTWRDYLQVLRIPHGTEELQPCIDCKIFLFSRARKSGGGKADF